MPNIKSSKKAVKVIAKKTAENHEYQAKVKNYIKKCDKAITAKDQKTAESLYQDVQKSIDKAVAKKLVSKNTSDRQKARLSKKIKAMK